MSFESRNDLMFTQTLEKCNTRQVTRDMHIAQKPEHVEIA